MKHWRIGFIILGLVLGQVFYANTPAIANDVENLLKKINLLRLENDKKPLYMRPALNQVASILAKNALAIKFKPDTPKLTIDRVLQSMNYPARRPVFIVHANNRSLDAHFADLARNAKWLKILLSAKHSDIGLVADRKMLRDQRKGGTLWGLVIAQPDPAAPQGWRQEVQKYVNQFRAEFNLPPLRLQTQLNQTAQLFSKRMALEDFVAHASPDGDRIGDRTKAQGYAYRKVLENLHGGKRLPEEAVEAWELSKDGHREAMLEPNIKDMGVGYYYLPFDDGNARYIHYWTLVMARPK